MILLRDLDRKNKEFVKVQTLTETTKNLLFVYQDSQIYFLDRFGQFTNIDSYQKFFNGTNLLEQLELEKIEEKLYLDNYLMPFNKEIKITTKTKEEYWLDCSLQKITFEDRSAILVTAKDITKYKQIEQKQEKILAEQKFVSMICHELKNPLNIISLSSNLLNKYDDRFASEKRQKYLERIDRGVDTLNLLIDEWLILEKAELGKLNLKLRALDIKDFCKNLLLDIQLDSSEETESFNNTISQQKINFICPQRDSIALTDSRILQLILTNLLENAMKYSPKDSEIDFIVNYNSDSFNFRIIDRGIGINAEDLEQLFEPFFRGDNVNETRGHGLGLSIVQKLVNLLHGKISVRSQVGLGTEFKVTFPRVKNK